MYIHACMCMHLLSIIFSLLDDLHITRNPWVVLCFRRLLQNLMKYTDPAKLVKANVNLYVPGIYIEKGGRLRQYPPSPEELECLYDLVSEFMTIE